MTTRLYFHVVSTTVGGTLPTTEQSTLTADVLIDQTTNKSMNRTIGAAVGVVNLTSLANTSLQNVFVRRFVSPLIYQSQILPNTWTYAFNAGEGNLNANFPVSGNNQPVYLNVYVWRPSTGTKIGTIIDGNTASTVDEGAVAATHYGHVVTFNGSMVTGMLAGDVLICEVWFRITQSTAAAQSLSFDYDGTTLPAENVSNSDAATYIETPETFNFTASNVFARAPATENVTISDAVIRASTHNMLRNPATEVVTITGTVTRIANKKRNPATETVTISSSVARSKNFIPPVNYVRNLPTEIVSITSSVGIIPNLAISKKYTSDRGYWQPVRPRIKIYALTDSSYSNALYTYDAFSDAGGTAKPISLSFESTTGNAGVFTLEIEDSTNTLDPNTFSRGNRVVIECSKDGSLYRIAFKGVIRSIDQRVYGQTGKNIILKGYSYLIRLTERVVDFQAQSLLDGSGNYIRTDSSMFTNTLLNTILTSDATYLYTQDDTALYNFFRINNIHSSSITQWIPRIDAQLATLNDAVDSIVEFSNSLLGINMSNDQLVLYNQDNVTADSQIFLVTNKVDRDSDSADTTMYPIEPYSYNFGYDFPDSASRLIASIGTNQCLPPAGEPDPIKASYTYVDFLYSGGARSLASTYQIDTSSITGLRLGVVAHGNLSSITSASVKIWGPVGPTVLTTFSDPGHGLGDVYNRATGPYQGAITLYVDGVLNKPFPDASASGDQLFVLAQQVGTAAFGITAGIYVIALQPPTGISSTNNLGWILQILNRWHGASSTSTSTDYTWTGHDFPLSVPYGYQVDSISAGTTYNSSCSPYLGPIISIWPSGGYYRWDFQGNILVPTSGPCGGPPNLADAEPNFLVAADMNQINRIGMIEKVITSLPDHIKNQQTMNEYFFAKIYSSSKPKFTFDFPSVTMPNIMPVAGDIVCHVDTLAKIGVAGNPIQTGIISQINYDFKQDDEGVLGLTKLALQTTGIKRGSY